MTKKEIEIVDQLAVLPGWQSNDRKFIRLMLRERTLYPNSPVNPVVHDALFTLRRKYFPTRREMHRKQSDHRKVTVSAKNFKRIY
jgi:hypothetical protein